MSDTQELTVHVEPDPQALAHYTGPRLIDIEGEAARLENFREFRDKILQPGKHFGTMPGVDRPFLQQPGAELFYRAMGCRPRYEIVEKFVDFADDFAYFMIKAEVVHVNSGEVIGEAIAACSTDEYATNCPTQRPRKADDDMQISCGEHGAGTGKSGWQWGREKGQKDQLVQCRGKSRQPLSRTLQNTLSKAEKRSMVAAIRTVGAISEMFTQDEDLMDNRNAPQREEPSRPASRSSRQKPAEAKQAPPPKEEPAPAPAATAPLTGAEAQVEFAKIKEANISAAELRGWLEDQGLLEAEEKIGAGIVARWMIATELPVTDFGAAVVSALGPPPADDVAEGEYTDPDDLPFE